MIAKFFTSAILLTSIFQAGYSFEIYHIPPENFLQGVPGQLEVLTPHYLDEPDFVRLYIRTNKGTTYQEVSFYSQDESWFCDIPASYMNVDTLYYYISASFCPAGFAAIPPNNPETNPFGVPLIRFRSKGVKFEPELMHEVIVDYTVTPWNKKPRRRSNNFPVLYISEPSSAFVESGYIKIIGNDKASAEDLLKSMMFLCLQENGDAITGLKYSLLSAQQKMSRVAGHIEIEGIYLRRPPRN